MSTTLSIASGAARLTARVAGEGEIVVLLHAGVGDSRVWPGVFEALARGRRAVAYDRRGFGGVAPVEEPYSQTGDLRAVLDAVGDGRSAVLIGCSQGGRIAIDAALAHPGRVRALVLIAPAVGGAPPADYPDEAKARLAALEAAEARGDLDAVNELEAQLWLDGALGEPGRVGGESRRLFLDMNGLTLRAPDLGSAKEAPPAYDRLGEIAAPTLVIWGDLDFPHIQVRSEHIAEAISGARGQVLRGVAHLPSLEQPDAVAALILEFLDALD